MPRLEDSFRAEITTHIHKELVDIATESGVSLTITDQEIFKLLAVPPQFDLGQAALPCFPFAKSLKVPPPKVAERIAAAINQAPRTYIAKVDAVGGYLNFHCQFETYGASVTQAIHSGSAFSNKLLTSEETEKIVVEYSQPNTHKALHVGHLRGLFLGDAVSRLLDYAGHNVVRATYPGDMGTHVAKVIWYINRFCKNALPTENRADWLGEAYAKADEEVSRAEGTPEAEQIKAEISKVLHSLKEESGEEYELWKMTREWSFDEMKKTYDWFGVHFDQWYTESECNKPSVALVKKKYEEGFFVKDQGAVGIDLSQWKLGFALFLKSDGNGIYLTKDLELLRRKFSDPAVTRSIYVVDCRQKLHFQQLFKTAELMGYPQAAKSVHLPFETINTPDGKAFSSRKLNGLRLHELRQAMETKVTTDFLERYRGTWSDEEIRQTAENVTIGALKYGMLKMDNNTQVTFVLDEWLRLDGDTGPYLQYVHARCRNILEKQGQAIEMQRLVLEERAERELLFTLGRFNDFVLQAAVQYRPSILAGYLLDLSRMFNRFYEACPIRSSTGDLRNSRLAIVDATARVIAAGLGLLGIPAPQKM